MNFFSHQKGIIDRKKNPFLKTFCPKFIIFYQNYEVLNQLQVHHQK